MFDHVCRHDRLAGLARHEPRNPATLHHPGTGRTSVSWYSKIMGRGERVIAVSQTAKQYLLDHCDVPPESIRVIYRGNRPCYLFGEIIDPVTPGLPTGMQNSRNCRASASSPCPAGWPRLKGHHHLVNLIRELKSSGHHRCRRNHCGRHGRPARGLHSQA